MTDFANRVRWALARHIAPAPIIAAPPGDGAAILMRDPASPNALAWIIPSTLDVTIENDLSIRAFGEAPADFGWSNRVGTIVGTI